MTKRTNKVLHSEEAESDNEPDTALRHGVKSRDDNVKSRDENVKSRDENEMARKNKIDLSTLDQDNSKARTNGIPVGRNTEMFAKNENGRQVQSSISPPTLKDLSLFPTNEFATDILTESRPSEMISDRVRKISNKHNSFPEKLGKHPLISEEKEGGMVSAQNDMDKKQNSSIFNPTCDVYTMPESFESAKRLKRVGKLSRIYRSIANKLGSLTERSESRQITHVVEKDSSSSEEDEEGDNVEKKLEKKKVVRFEDDDDNEQTPSQVINNLFKHSSEETVLKTFHQLIHMGENLNDLDKDESGRSVLHKAVEKNFLSVVEKFLDYGFDPLSYDSSMEIPLHIAIRRNYDEMAALIVSKLNNFVVRRLFGDDKSKVSKHGAKSTEQKSNSGQSAHTNKLIVFGTFDENTVKPMFTINELIARGLDQTLLRVLDSFLEEQRNGLYKVHIKLLDIDNARNEPTDMNFDFEYHTAFQDMATCDKKDALNHPAVRTYVEHKWGKWCQTRFLSYFFMYLFSLFCWTYSAVTGVSAPDIQTYDTRLQHSRAFFEVIAYLFAVAVLFTEIRQIIRHGRQYFTQVFNLLELTSSVLLVMVLPLRYTNVRVHWYIFAIGYCLWAIRIFKYSVVFSITGIYAEVIKRIIAQDFVQFGILFAAVNLIFSGTFLLILKADDNLDTFADTSSFQSIMYVGLRTLIEAGPIVEYSGTEGYRTAGIIFMMVYMCFTIVALLNILIAQVSETYTRTHGDCVKTVRANRAWTVARAERNEWHILPRQPNRVKHFKRIIKDVDIKAIEKKENSTIEVISSKIEKIQNKQIKDGLEVQTVKTRLRNMTQHLEMKVDHLSQQLEEIKELLRSK